MAENIIEKTTHFVKEHPLAVGGVVIGGLLLYLLLSSSSSANNATATTSSGYDPNLLAYNAQMAQLQYAAAAQDNQTAAQVAIAQIGANTQGQQVNAAQTVSLAGIQAQQNIQTSAQGTQIAIAQLASDTNVAQINATRDIALGQDATFSNIAAVNAGAQENIAETSALASTISSLSSKKYATISASTPSGLSFDINTGKSGGGSSNIGGVLTGAASLIGSIF